MKSLKPSGAFACALAMTLVLVACGGNAGSVVSSSTSSESASATSSGTSSAAVSEVATGQAPSECYIIAKLNITGNDGTTIASSFTYDDRGRQQTSSLDFASPTLTYDIDGTITDWDEYGHLVKAVETDDYGDGKPSTATTEVSAHELNADGTIAAATLVSTINKESFEEGEVASTKTASTWEYGDDAQIYRKLETKTEYFDKAGALLMSETKTSEFDEDGLETRFTCKYVYADGSELNETGDITWVKDADDKPISFTLVLSQDGVDATMSTGDVKTDESGLISWVGNIKVDGEAFSTTATIDYLKIDNPVPNAYEGWKNFTLTNVILGRTDDTTEQGA